MIPLYYSTAMIFGYFIYNMLYPYIQKRTVINLLKDASQKDKIIVKFKQDSDKIIIYKNPSSIDNIHPIILVPGLAGTRIDVKYTTKPCWPWSVINTNNDPFPIWLSLGALLASSSWKNLFSVQSEEKDGKLCWTEKNPDIVSSTAAMGSLEGIDTLLTIDNYDIYCAYYMHGLIQHLKEYYKSANVNPEKYLYGAGYDWRMNLDYNRTEKYHQDLKELIERVYSQTKKRVFLLGHSMGCPTSSLFIQSQDPEWVKKYISGFIPLQGPFGGAPKALRALISGDNFGSIMANEDYQDIESSCAGLLWMIPDSNIFTHNVVTTPSYRYTCSSNDIDVIMNLKNIANSKLIIDEILSRRNKMYNHPGVPSFPIVGSTLKLSSPGTECGYYYDSEISLINSHPVIVTEDKIYSQTIANNPVIKDYAKDLGLENLIGDTTVPFLSLRVPEYFWKQEKYNKLKKLTQFRSFSGGNEVNHTGILSNSDVIQYIWNITLQEYD